MFGDAHTIEKRSGYQRWKTSFGKIHFHLGLLFFPSSVSCRPRSRASHGSLAKMSRMLGIPAPNVHNVLFVTEFRALYTERTTTMIPSVVHAIKLPKFRHGESDGGSGGVGARTGKSTSRGRWGGKGRAYYRQNINQADWQPLQVRVAVLRYGRWAVGSFFFYTQPPPLYYLIGIRILLL